MINLTIANCIQVYIGDLGSEATKYELEDAFTPFGAVKNVWIAKKPPGKSVSRLLTRHLEIRLESAFVSWQGSRSC